MKLHNYDPLAYASDRLENIIIISIVCFVSFVLLTCAIYFWNKKRKDSRARLAARQERAIVSLYVDTFNPHPFGQTGCVVCKHANIFQFTMWTYIL
jgi:hypothetical protein